MSSLKKLKNLIWIEDYLPEDIFAEPMHDGIGYFWREKLVLMLIESSQTALHRGVTYPFQIWNGCFFPIEKIKQNAVIKKFLFLENHPVLQNCLYIPAEDENFEELVKMVLSEVFRGNPLFGEFVKIKKPTAKEKAARKSNSMNNKPTLFTSDSEDESPVENSPKPVKKNKSKKSVRSKKSKTNKKHENNFILSKIR